MLLRVHPAASRVRTLAEAHSARLMVFDLLADERGRALVDLPLEERRPRLEAPPGNRGQARCEKVTKITI